MINTVKLGVAIMALALSSTAIAITPEVPPPPKVENLCSPGYWKNHTNVWWSWSLELSSDVLLEMLKAKGPGGEAFRREAQAILNSAADATGKLVCEDIDDYFL
jgi:hypothetical protein